MWLIRYKCYHANLLTKYMIEKNLIFAALRTFCCDPNFSYVLSLAPSIRNLKVLIARIGVNSQLCRHLQSKKLRRPPIGNPRVSMRGSVIPMVARRDYSLTTIVLRVPTGK